MSKIKSAKKRYLQSYKKRKSNISCKSVIKTFFKKVNFYINKKDKKLSNNAFCIFQSIIDRQSTKGLIHKNKASRYKKKLIKKIKNIDFN
ncbi:MAG: 30S ribosomal protein S20 [Enterobacterales bacterium]